jgi:5'-phosphate synthase pdxT subunit
MRIAILSLQGAFAEHEAMLRQLGAETFEVRKLSDWQQPKDGLIIPGGESTTQMKLLRELGMAYVVKEAINEGLPVFGTCAGLIMLSQSHLATMDIEAQRNAYGRQLGSFSAVHEVAEIGKDIPMTFIRAPFINRVYGKARELATVDGRVVAARQDNQLVTAFHPELTDDLRIHDYFLSIIGCWGLGDWCGVMGVRCW